MQISAGGLRPGQLVQRRGEAWEVVYDPELPSYPDVGSEVMRMGRARIENLHRRSRMLSSVRGFFEQMDYTEIESPQRVRAPGMEVNIQAVSCGDKWLITSPEFHLKRLLAGGFERIFSVSRCFRQEEEGPNHSVEFSMLEWYRAWSTLEEVQQETVRLLDVVAKRLDVTSFRSGTHTASAFSGVETHTVSELFDRCAGVTLQGDESVRDLKKAVESAGLVPARSENWDDVFYEVFVDKVEPFLAERKRPVFVTEWPVRLAALAKQIEETAVVERFELYICGVELANAFGELTCAKTQRARFVEEQEDRRRRGYTVYPVDERFIAALAEGVPPSAGIALGVDRLAMLLCGATSIAHVQAFFGSEI